MQRFIIEQIMRGKTPIFPVEQLNNFSVPFQVFVPFTFGPTVRQISMSSSEPGTATNPVVTGWGALSSDGTNLPTQLQAVDVNIIARTTCNNNYAPGREVTANMICAGAAGLGICNGDFGGPLVVGGQLAGIASWGIGCADGQHPGVYTSVAKIRSFVTQLTGVQ
jgi:trypsin